MARISEIVVAIEAEGTEKVLAALNQVEGAQVKSVKTTKQLGAQTKQATEQASEGWATLVTGVNQAMGAMKKVVKIGKAVYDFTKQGAELEFMAGKFDRLSLSIGTTSDVLLEELRKATQGTRSDMELMASASDFMALGFAKTSDEAVRLSTVAGALNMNMNQLVLTLANQTTMRFDQLGVSVDGFKEKVKALEDAGLSANDAFKEAFLQQAEEQVRKVGNATDSAVGSFMQLEASFTNFSNALKVGTSNAISPAVKELSKLLQLYAGRMQGNQAFNDLADQLERAGVAADDFNQKFADTKNLAGWIVEVDDYNALLAEMRASLDQATAGETEWNDKMLDSLVTLQQIPAAADGAGQAVERFAVSSESAAYAVDNFLEKAGIFKDDFAEIFSLSKNLSGMISFAKSYDDVAAKIAEIDEKMAKSGAWTRQQLEKEKTALLQDMADMANQVTLDMFQATIAIGGVTETEMQAYFKMAEQMGIISHDAAQAAIAAYNDAVAAVSSASLDVKGNYTVDASQAYSALNQLVNDFEYINGMITFEVYYKNKTGEALLPPTTSAGDIFGIPKVVSSAIEATVTPTWAKTDFFTKSIEVPAAISTFDTSSYDDWQPADKPFISAAELDSSEVDAWTPPTKYGNVIYLPKGSAGPEAIGGPVYPNNNYLWQEPGREGEMFIPEKYGRVMNNHQVAQMMRDAMFTSNAGGGSSGGSSVTTDRSVHNTYHINAQYKQEPVLTLSQHLKILSTLGGRA